MFAHVLLNLLNKLQRLMYKKILTITGICLNIVFLSGPHLFCLFREPL